MTESDLNKAAEELGQALANDSILIRQAMEVMGKLATIINRAERNCHDRAIPDLEAYPVEARFKTMVTLVQRYSATEIARSVR